MFLGIDTSCYTTSVALLDRKGTLVEDKRKLLEVKSGERGLRQSEMVFQHIKNLPFLLEQVFLNKKIDVDAIAVSDRPRSKEDSYMPAFVSGVSIARSLATFYNKNLYFLTHQENHIKAGLWSAKEPKSGRFIVLHMSGGTTDLLLVENKKNKPFSIKEIGGTIDINAGQFIDRIGVLLGTGFPAGPTIEKLALQAKYIEEIPFYAKNTDVSFSGPLTATEKLIKKGKDRFAIAAGVEHSIAKSLSKIIINASLNENINEVLLVGGVASNMFIKKYLNDKLVEKNIKTYYPDSAYSGDNAIGCAAFAWEKWREDNE